ncbi:MAG TPA: HupE/UreJ family protein [Ideonella sp.]|uniref:HupE/UreJ family protein n=1 Tax=Ideonella sp. TaxID=1929293 RepID=UPI002E3184E6|nr:HupE/UreJ family protein [Ideonella sp.]HEX5686806.1 HupE/UreJ family protein [Ideonella sp.]
MSHPLSSARMERSSRLLLASAATAAAMLLSPPAARAHAPSNATLSLVADGQAVQQRWDIALRDLDRVLPLDADDDGQITWGELRQAWPQVVALADEGLRLSPAVPGHASGANAACVADAPAAPRIDDHADGTYAVLERRWHCPADAGKSGVRVDYRLFADSDASHRGLLQWRINATAPADIAVLAPAAGPVLLAGSAGSQAPADPASSSDPRGTADNRGADGSPASTFAGVVAEGVHHILIGTDHVLFLLALMLPAVMGVRGAGVKHTAVNGDGPDNGRRWLGPDPSSHDDAPMAWTGALLQVAKVVTAFTVAHSITLAIAVLGYADPPSRIVESLIAASVVLAAIDNLRRFLPGVRWQLAFVFGLVHGFGFAGALKELGLDQAALARTLVGFNLGVELGQLGIVAIALPLAWWVRDTRFYRRVVLGGGSVAIAAVAALWFAERAFDLALIS